MAGTDYHDSEWHRSRQHVHESAHPDARYEREFGAAMAEGYNPSLLAAPGLGKSANIPTRASLLGGMQATHGNRAVQRQVGPNHRNTNLPVQRFWDDLIGSVLSGDDKHQPIPTGLMPADYFDGGAGPSMPTGLMPADYFDGGGPYPAGVPTGLLDPLDPGSGGFYTAGVSTGLIDALQPPIPHVPAPNTTMPPAGGFMPAEYFEDGSAMPPTGFMDPAVSARIVEQARAAAGDGGGGTRHIERRFPATTPGYLAPNLPGGFLPVEPGPIPPGGYLAPGLPGGLLDPLHPAPPIGPGGLLDPILPLGPGGLVGPSQPVEPGEKGSKFKSMDDLFNWGKGKLGGAADFVAENPAVVLSLLGGGFSGAGGKKEETSIFDDPTKWAGDLANQAVDDPMGAVKKAWQHTPLGYAATETNQFFTGKTEIGPDGKPRRGPSTFDRGVDAVTGFVAEGARSVADEVEGVPVIGEMADAGASAAEFGTRVHAGIWKGAGVLMGGVSGMAADPTSAPKRAWQLGENMPLPPSVNPFRLAHAGYDVISGEKSLGEAYDQHLDPVNAAKQKFAHNTGIVEGYLDPYKQAYERGDYGEMVGRAGFDLAMLALGGGSARGGQAGRGTRGTSGTSMVDDGVRVVDKVDDVARPRPPQKVMEMDPVPPDFYPGMPQPPGWQSGPYGFRGPSPVNPHGKTLPGATYDPFPNPVQVPAGKGPVNPYGPTIDVGTGPVNPHGKTWLDVSKGGVDPHGKTVRVPADPYSPTRPGYGARGGTPDAPTRLDVPEVSPYAPTAPMPANPYAPTAPMPVNPYAPTELVPVPPGYVPNYGPHGTMPGYMPGPPGMPGPHGTQTFQSPYAPATPPYSPAHPTYMPGPHGTQGMPVQSPIIAPVSSGTPALAGMGEGVWDLLKRAYQNLL